MTLNPACNPTSLHATPFARGHEQGLSDFILHHYDTCNLVNVARFAIQCDDGSSPGSATHLKPVQPEASLHKDLREAMTSDNIQPVPRVQDILTYPWPV